MNIEEHREVAEPIIVQAAENKLSDDELKMELMIAGIPFSHLNQVVKTISIGLGLMADPKEVSNGVKELVEQIASDTLENLESYDALSDIVESVVNNVDGATPQRVLSILRAHARDEFDIELPKKPRSAGTGRKIGKVAQAVVELYSQNSNPTKQEFYDAMIPAVGGDQQHSNIIYYMGLHMAVCSAIANGESLETVAKSLANQSNPEPGEGVANEPRGAKGEGASAEADADDDEEYDDEEELV